MSISKWWSNMDGMLRAAIVLGSLLLILVLVDISTWKPAAKIIQPKKNISKEEITHGDLSKKQIIFTFDGGSGIQSAEKILEVLAKHHVKGTFFLTGKFIEQYPTIVKEISDAGHEIFNHTYDHPHLPTISDEEMVKEFSDMNNLLKITVQKDSAPYFRAPYGDRDQRVRDVAFDAGYESVYWTVDANDWEESDGMTSEEVKNNILSTLANGNIYLMHLGDNITGAILDEVFTTIETRGYKLVSLTEGL